MVSSELMSALSDDDLESTLLRGTAEQAAHMARWLQALAEFDQRRVWERCGTISASSWLSLNCGISGRTAREHVRVAHALEDLPLIHEAFGDGRLSYSKVRVVCRVARADNQQFLLGLAMDLTASQLERTIASYEVTQRPKLTPEEDMARRAGCDVVTSWTDARGMVHYEFVVPPEESLVIDRAIEYGQARIYKQRRAAAKAAKGEGREPEPVAKRTHRQRRLDGLLWALRNGLANAERDPLPVDDPFLIVLHLQEGSASINGDGNIDLGNGLAVSPATLQRLCCNSQIQALLGRPDISGDRAPSRLDLGRRRRTATRDQKVALSAFYPTCVFPGCDIPVRWCQFHHLQYWARDKGRSDLDNYRPLCRKHHRDVHEGGWELIIDAGDKVMAISPTGRRVQTGRPLTDEAVSADALNARIDALGFDRDDPDRGAQLAGRWGAARMTRWAENEIYCELLQHCGGADPTADVIAHAATAIADDHFFRGEPPNNN